MNARLPTILFACLCATSCDKAKHLADQAGTKVRDRIAARIGGGNATDPALGKLVDQTPDGVIFRKDLPFPKRVSVRTTRRQQWSGRLYQPSEIGQRAENLNGTRLTVTRLERSADEIRHTLEQAGFQIPSPDDPDSEGKTLADPLSAFTPANSTVTLLKDGNNWKGAPDGGFRAATIARELTPVMDPLLVENALAPRSLWFSPKKRFKTGDTLTVAGSSLPMLVPGKAVGSLDLKLESIGAVDGHPCGVFAVIGHYQRTAFPDFEGAFTDEDVTIQSGKLWLSLIHPIILREELDTIQTLKSGSRGAQNVRSQGTIKVSIKREWKALEG
jgi:hypothetical protein